METVGRCRYENPIVVYSSDETLMYELEQMRDHFIKEIVQKYYDRGGKEVMDARDVAMKANENIKQLKGQLACTLSKLNSPNKLKNEFPEAYKVYLSLEEVDKGSENLCDSIENLRAKLKK